MDTARARRNMVDGQIRTNHVTEERLLAAMDALPREHFLPAGLRSVAYVDEDVALGNGRVLLEPLVQARLIQTAEVQAGDVVLDVACGPGYSAALLARLASAVVALESDPALAAQATDNLARLGMHTVSVVEGALARGLPAQAPFDVIVIEGAVPQVPKTLFDQLAEGAIVGEGPVGRITLFAKRHGLAGERALFDAATPMLAGFERPRAFAF